MHEKERERHEETYGERWRETAFSGCLDPLLGDIDISVLLSMESLQI